MMTGKFVVFVLGIISSAACKQIYGVSLPSVFDLSPQLTHLRSLHGTLGTSVTSFSKATLPQTGELDLLFSVLYNVSGRSGPTCSRIRSPLDVTGLECFQNGSTSFEVKSFVCYSVGQYAHGLFLPVAPG
jgi:hypothetical protein